MARIKTIGFELNSTTPGVEWGEDVVDSPTISTTTKRSGGYAGRINSLTTGTPRYFQHRFATADGNGPYFVRFYLYITTLPNATTTIANLQRGSTDFIVQLGVKLNTSGQLQLFNAATDTQIGSSSSALSTGTWYRVEFQINCSGAGATDTAELKLDGSTVATSSTQNFSSGVALFALGGNLNSESCTTIDIFFDDVAINDSTGSAQTSYPGAGSVVCMRPTADGDNKQWQSQASGSQGTATFGAVDEVTPNDATDYNRRTTNSPATTPIDDWNVESSSNVGIGSTDTVTLVQIEVRAGATSATSTGRSIKTRIKSAASGTTSESATTDISVNGWLTDIDATARNPQLTSYTDPTTGTAWTPTGTNSLDNMQIGYQAAVSSTNEIRVSAIWAVVEFVPNTTVTISPNDISISLTEDASTISQNHIVASTDVAVALTEDAGTIMQNHDIPAQDIAIATTEDNTTISQDHNVSVQDIAVGITEDNTTITQVQIIQLQDITIFLTEDNATITQNHIISPADILTSLTEDATTVTEDGIVLITNDIAIALSADNTTISQNHIVVIQDVIVSLTEDATTINQNHVLPVADLALALNIDPSSISQNHVLSLADLTVYLAADSTTLSQIHIIITADILVSILEDNASISQNHIFSPADLLISTGEDNVTLSQIHSITPADILLSLGIENTEISSEVFLSPDSILLAVTEDGSSIVITALISNWYRLNDGRGTIGSPNATDWYERESAGFSTPNDSTFIEEQESCDSTPNNSWYT